MTDSNQNHAESWSRHYIEQARVHLERARRHHEAGDSEAGLEECDRGLEIDPGSAELVNLRGAILEGMGEYREAERHYKRAMALDPDFAEARGNLASVRATLRDITTGPERELVTIATFSFPAEAYLRQARLEAEGIRAIVADDYTVTMNWLYSTAIGGVKLQVQACDVEQALSILEREQTNSDSEESGLQLSPDHPICPRCGSSHTHYERFEPRLLFLSWLLLTFPLPFLKREWKCSACGNYWQPGHEQSPSNGMPYNGILLLLGLLLIPLAVMSEGFVRVVAAPLAGFALLAALVLTRNRRSAQQSDLVCPRCENRVSEEWTVCPNCAEPLIEMGGYCCSNCDWDVEADWTECPNCGEPL